MSELDRKESEWAKANPGMTLWHNETKNTQRCKVYLGPRNWGIVEVPPGESRAFPTDWEPGIQRINAEGVIVGGLCPLLRRMDGPTLRDRKGVEVTGPTKLHEALDPALAEKRDAKDRLAELQLEELLAEKQAKIERDRKEAADLKAANDAAAAKHQQNNRK